MALRRAVVLATLFGEAPALGEVDVCGPGGGACAAAAAAAAAAEPDAVGLYQLRATAPSKEGPDWVAAFLHPESARDLCDRAVALQTEGNCNHMTVWYNPPAEDMARMAVHFGENVTLEVLGFGGAEAATGQKSRAALVLASSPSGLGAQTINQWPHVTLESDEPPYSPVYSNCLFERIMSASGASVTREISTENKYMHRVLGVTFAGHATWNGQLPSPYENPTAEWPGGGRACRSAQYEASAGFFTTLASKMTLHATFCRNSAWDRSEYACKA